MANKNIKSLAYLVNLKMLAEAFETLEQVLFLSDNSIDDFKKYLIETNTDEKTYFQELQKELMSTSDCLLYLINRMNFLKEKLAFRVANEKK